MMTLQDVRRLVNCPICGRPVRTRRQQLEHPIACSHCRGEFIVHESADGSLATSRLHGSDALRQADYLLHRAANHANTRSAHRCQRLFQVISMLGSEAWPDTSRIARLVASRNSVDQQPLVCVVEHRDNVFALLAAEMEKCGMRIIRATSATEALQLHGRCWPDIVLANIHLPDQSGWLLAAKLQFIDRHARVWIYQQQSTNYDRGLATLVNAEALLSHRGDVPGFAETIVTLLTTRRASRRARLPSAPATDVASEVQATPNCSRVPADRAPRAA